MHNDSSGSTPVAWGLLRGGNKAHLFLHEQSIEGWLPGTTLCHHAASYYPHPAPDTAPRCRHCLRYWAAGGDTLVLLPSLDERLEEALKGVGDYKYAMVVDEPILAANKVLTDLERQYVSDMAVYYPHWRRVLSWLAGHYRRQREGTSPFAASRAGRLGYAPDGSLWYRPLPHQRHIANPETRNQHTEWLMHMNEAYWQ